MLHVLSQVTVASVNTEPAGHVQIDEPTALVELLRVRVFDRVPVALTAVVDTSPQTLQCALELPSPA